MDIRERQGSIRSSLSFSQMTDDEFEDQQYFDKLRKQLIRQFSNMFKEDQVPRIVWTLSL